MFLAVFSFAIIVSLGKAGELYIETPFSIVKQYNDNSFYETNNKSTTITASQIIIEDPYKKFDHLTKKDGLSSNYILDIFQDKYGFIWIATTEGLNRYDGNNVRQYRHILEDSTSLAADLVTCIIEDLEGNMWVGSKNGLNRYNRNNDSFEIVFMENNQGIIVEIRGYIRALLPDKNNVLWIETAQGELIKYDYSNKTSTIYHHRQPSMINTYYYHELYKDNEGMIWLGGRFMGLYRFNPQTEQFYEYQADENDKTKKRENDVSMYLQKTKNEMWLGGIDGLYNLNTASGIFDKTLSVSTFCVAKDHNGKLWFGTGSGIYIFDNADNSFTYIDSDDNNPRSRINGHVNKIFVDAAKNVWIGTIDGISIFRQSKNKFRHIYHIPGDERTPSSSYITAILQINSGEILVGTANYGIDCLNQDFIKTRNLNNTENSNSRINSNKISALMQDSDGDVWAGQWSGRGFNIIDPNTLSVRSFSFLKNSLKADWYNDIFEDSKGNYWLGIWGAMGLYQFDKRIGVFKDQTYQLKHAVPPGQITNLVFDGKDLWVGFKNQSIFYSINPETKRVTCYPKDNYSGYDFNRISNIHANSKGKVWFETNKGFYRKQANPYISIVPVWKTSIPHVKFNKETLIDTILCQATGPDNDKWIGTYNGLSRIRDGKVICHYSKSTNRGLISDTILSIAFTPSGLWLGTINGLCNFDLQTQKFSAFIVDKEKYLSSHLVKCIAEDRNGYIWVGTTNKGLNRLDPVTNEVRQFRSDPDDANSFWGDAVNCIFVDREGTVWIGAYGLNKYSQGTDSFTHFTSEEGMADNDVMSILEDDSGRLWIATLNGLSVFDTEKEIFQNYYEKDGLQDNEFTNAAYRLKSGELIFGGKNGINVCNPSHIFKNDKPPQLSIVSFSIFDKKKDVDLSGTKVVNLNFRENYFSFEFAALDFSNPKYIKYAYKLEGAEKDWTYTSAANHFAKYTNIDPGKYRLRVIAANGDGIWNEAGIFIDIIIKPPYWKTTWFIILEILFITLIIILIVKYRERKIIEKNQVQLLEQKLLRSQMNPHFIFNSLSSIQSFIFENNPLEAGSYLSRFAELIRSILYNSREEFITIEKEINTLQNYLDLQQLRYNNKFDYIIDVDPLIQADIIKIPPMLAQPFIENAIEHGVKHLKGKGHISISFSLMPEKKSILLLIEDNGVGIKASNKLKEKIKKRHTSLATIIANERIDVFNKGQKKKQFVMEINEIKDSDENVKGTKVKFIIPYKEL